MWFAFFIWQEKIDLSVWNWPFWIVLRCSDYFPELLWSSKKKTWFKIFSLFQDHSFTLLHIKTRFSIKETIDWLGEKPTQTPVFNNSDFLERKNVTIYIHNTVERTFRLLLTTSFVKLENKNRFKCIRLMEWAVSRESLTLFTFHASGKCGGEQFNIWRALRNARRD